MTTLTFTHESDIGRDDLVLLTVTATVWDGEVVEVEAVPELSGERERDYLMKVATNILLREAADTTEFNRRLRAA